LRALLAVPAVAVATLVLGGPALLGGLVDRSGDAAHAVARLWARLVLRACGVDVELDGVAAPPPPAVYAANHASALDIPVLFGYLPASFRIIYKRSLSWVPFLGWFLYLGGHVAIDRGNAFRAKKSLDRAAARIRRGMSVAVFPEGTRSRDGGVGHFKRGSFSLALSAGVPVVPVSLVGVKSVVPAGLLSVRPGRVRVVMHPPVATAGCDPESAPALAEQVRLIVARGAGQA
jgi:1-acyl-sn-glycerol-3-phosphate acyltransferase